MRAVYIKPHGLADTEICVVLSAHSESHGLVKRPIDESSMSIRSPDRSGQNNVPTEASENKEKGIKKPMPLVCPEE